MKNQDSYYQKGMKFYADKACKKPLRFAGQTATQWGKEYFEYEYCTECGKDLKDHHIIPFNGNWFAYCLTEHEEVRERINRNGTQRSPFGIGS